MYRIMSKACAHPNEHTPQSDPKHLLNNDQRTSSNSDYLKRLKKSHTRNEMASHTLQINNSATES